MEFKDLAQKNAGELERMLAEERATLHGLQLKLSVNQLKTVRDVRKTRQNIARILTQLRRLDQTAELR